MAYGGAPSAPEPSASPEIASSTAAVHHRKDPPPLYPSAARAKDCPPDSERGGLLFDARQHNAERRLGVQRAFEPATRAAVVARRCGESARECLELAQKLRAAHSSGDESDANGYETDTTFTIDDALDDDDGDEHGDESMATFPSAKTIHESTDVVRVAAFPSPPLMEREDPAEVDWEAAQPPRDQWPADLGDLYANNPAGARTWPEVEAAMQRLVIYHAVRDMSRILSVTARRARRASARTRTRTQRTLPAARRRCRCLMPLQTKTGLVSMRLNRARRVHGTAPSGPRAQIGPGESGRLCEATTHRSYGTTAPK